MSQPQIDGMEVLGLVGEGSCGTVYIARDEKGAEAAIPGTQWYAVRVFNSLAVNRPLIEGMVKRLSNIAVPDGLVPVIWKQSQQGSKCMVMPLYAEVNEEKGTIETRSLQERIGDFPSKSAWGIIDQIANALGGMHHNHLPHGNLKPGNIFFDDAGKIFLTDYAMGHMPGVGMLPFTDALLYAPPEQLREPEGYTSGKGYGWDVYAFAALSFRLLTGKFPRCESTFSKVAPGPGESHVSGIQADVTKLAERLEHRELTNWPEEASSDKERKKREVIQRCLSLDPKDRYKDVTEVIHAWEAIDNDADAAEEKAALRKRIFLNKAGMFTALALAVAGGIGCLTLYGLLSNEKSGRAADISSREQTISTLKSSRDNAKTAQIKANAARAKAEQREVKLREQLLALGVTNDRVLAWLFRSRNKDLPELKTGGTDADILERELGEFLKLTEGENQFQPVRARIAMQLAELAIHRKKPALANDLLEKSLTAWKTAGIIESGHDYRLARARLIILMQSLDKKNKELTDNVLPKTRKAVSQLSSADPTEMSRINALMQLIDGRLIEASDPNKALEHFQLAIENLNGISKAMPDNINVRSELAHYNLHSAALAEGLELVEDATKLRGVAATHLKWLLEKNPNLKLAKVKLAELEIMAAEADMHAGNESEGAKKLASAEALLKGLPPGDTEFNGASMQIAAAKGLRAVLMRDLGRTTDAAKTLDEAIGITEKIVSAHPQSSEPLYRLAVFNWQRAGLAGDAGDTDNELKLGSEAANLMQQLLSQGAGKRDTELRRSLAYLYGDLGHTASSKGKKTEAAEHFKSASKMWLSLIKKIGKKEEFAEGLNWSKQRYREVGGR
ncbi:MAG: hypothetical protein AB8F34_01005 [Akkermansiaceae bacterium]